MRLFLGYESVAMRGGSGLLLVVKTVFSFLAVSFLDGGVFVVM